MKANPANSARITNGFEIAPVTNATPVRTAHNHQGHSFMDPTVHLHWGPAQ